MSASITSDRSKVRKRGTMLAYIFANQGWGSFMGSLMTIIVLAIYKHVMDVEGKTSKVDGGTFFLFFVELLIIDWFLVWRIVVGLSLIPAFGTLYQRLTLPESTRYIESQKLQMNEEAFEAKKANNIDATKEVESSSSNCPSSEDKVEEDIKKKAHFSG